MSDFVKGSRPVRKELPDGQWVEFKSELTYGEQKKLTGAAQAYFDFEGKLRLDADYSQHAIVRLSTWITDWSFVDESGSPVTPNRQSIAALTAERGNQIDSALDDHIAELEAKKVKTPTG